MRTELVSGKISFFSVNFIKAYVITMRPYLMFVSGITGIAGMSFGALSFSPGYLLLFSAAFLSYGFGQALTDCFQIDTDSISSPYRPLTKGTVSRYQFLFISVTGLTYCVLVFAYFNTVNLVLGIISGLGLATYTPFKRRWWGGPFYNSWIVGVLFIISSLSVIGTSAVLFSDTFIFSLCAVFFGYANFVLSGYFKDISADCATGYNTLPVVFGRKISSFVSDLFALITLVFTSLVLLKIFENSDSFYFIISILFFTGGATTLIFAQTHLHLVKTDYESYHAISYVVHSYILLLSAITIANKPDWSLFLIIYCICYLIVLKIRPAKNQI
ncbi:MAG: UbiA family prenyltransferase [Ignavibacteriaceae bacterium]